MTAVLALWLIPSAIAGCLTVIAGRGPAVLAWYASLVRRVIS